MGSLRKYAPNLVGPFPTSIPTFSSIPQSTTKLLNIFKYFIRFCITWKMQSLQWNPQCAKKLASGIHTSNYKAKQIRTEQTRGAKPCKRTKPYEEGGNEVEPSPRRVLTLHSGFSTHRPDKFWTYGSTKTKVLGDGFTFTGADTEHF